MLSDDALIERSMSDPPAFVELLERHGRAIHAYLARRAGVQCADDLFNEIWLQAFRSRDRYRSRAADARPWLYGIARNVLRVHWRGRVPTSPSGEPVVDPWDGVDNRLDADRRRAAIRLALADLDTDDREVLLLVAWEGLTPAEVARCIGAPAGTVRWRLHRARAQLRCALGDLLDDHVLEAKEAAHG